MSISSSAMRAPPGNDRGGEAPAQAWAFKAAFQIPGEVGALCSGSAPSPRLCSRPPGKRWCCSSTIKSPASLLVPTSSAAPGSTNKGPVQAPPQPLLLMESGCCCYSQTMQPPAHGSGRRCRVLQAPFSGDTEREAWGCPR